jgi:hypothetical protein
MTRALGPRKIPLRLTSHTPPVTIAFNCHKKIAMLAVESPRFVAVPVYSSMGAV